MFNDVILVFKPPGKPLIPLLTMCYKFLNTLIDFQKPAMVTGGLLFNI